MAGFASFDDLINQYSANDQIRDWPFFKYPLPTTLSQGRMFSLFLANGNPGAAPAPASAPGEVMDNNAGGVWLQDEASDWKYLISAEANVGRPGSLFLFDVLAAVSGIATTATGGISIGTGALNRYADGMYNQVWLECTTPSSGTAAQLSISSYTDEDGNAGQSGPAFTMPVTPSILSELFPIPIHSADKGVREVTSLNVNVASGAGVYNLYMVHPLAVIPVNIGMGGQIDFVRGVPPPRRIYDGATLALALTLNTTAPAYVLGDLFFAWG